MCSRGPRGKMAEGAATEHEKTVLVCLGERKRAVTFRSGGGNEVESLLESVKEVYKDVLGTNVSNFSSSRNGRGSLSMSRAVPFLTNRF